MPYRHCFTAPAPEAARQRLLRQTDLGIDEIALRCGYKSLPSFARRFKAAFKVGPGGFRRTLQQR